MRNLLIDAEPEPIEVDPARTAVVIIDMQRDFLEPGGFGETLGNNVALLNAAVEPCKALLAAPQAKASTGLRPLPAAFRSESEPFGRIDILLLNCFKHQRQRK